MTPVQFLKKFHPDRPWVLTAISSDRKGVVTRAFSPDDSRAAADWIKDQSEKKRNLYFSVAEVITPENKKAARENIARVHWLHVDIDAGPGDLLGELERIKTLVTSEVAGVPKPTVVVYSGGGYQAFWRLKTPIEINGEEAAYTSAARYNKQIELLYGGDNCHNVDRIMRLPGTTNIPNAQKVAKGRVPVDASVVYFDKTSYELSDFQQAAETSPARSAGDFSVEISGNVPRLNTVDELDEWNIADRVKVIIVQGRHPDEVKENDSRSEWLFDAVCQMVRASVTDEVIYGVITDPNFGISESVLEARDVDRYAKRQIERAKMEVESSNLRMLNERHAVITNLGGKCLVVEELWDPVMERHRLATQSFADFRNRYMNQSEIVMVDTKDGPKPKAVKLGHWWLEHPKRRQYEQLVFAPGIDTPHYNLWQGWAYNALPGTKHQCLLDHMLKVICVGNHEHYAYLLGWMGTLVQRPASPGGTCVVMRGSQGTGKSFLAKHFGKLFGRHFLHISNASHLTGNFNNHLRDALLVFGDEAFYAGDKRHVNVLKTLITEDTLMIEAKGRDVEAAPNFANLMLASNSEWVVPVEGQDRRFFVVDVSEDHIRDNAYFAAMQDSLEDGGYENLLYYLMNYDLTHFNLFDVPQTSALADQKTHSLLPHEEWWFNVLLEGSIRQGMPWGAHPIEITNPELHDAYIDYCQMASNAGQRLTRQKLIHYVMKMMRGLEIGNRITTKDGNKIRVKRLPPIMEARSAWNSITRSDVTWDNPADDEEGEDLPF